MEGERHKQMLFPIFDDSFPEDVENFSITLGDATGGAKIDSNADSLSVTILSNDGAHGIIEFSQV